MLRLSGLTLCLLVATGTGCKGEVLGSAGDHPEVPGDSRGASGDNGQGDHPGLPGDSWSGDPYRRPTGPWADERWVVSAFTKSMGGGPDFGPAVDAGASVHTSTADAQGNIYILVGSSNIATHRVDIITPGGRRVPLAGTGRRGYRDGPAAHAQFDFSRYSYYPANLQVDDRGYVFVADTGNGAIRRVYKDGNDDWMVDTWAGGGQTSLEVGETTAPRDAKLPGLIIAATRQGRVIGCSISGCYDINSEGTQIRYLGRLQEINPASGEQVKMNVFQGDCDNAGMCYFITRSPDYVLRVSATGELERIAGFLIAGPPKPHERGDLPPLEAYFDTTPSLVADPDGTAVYVCGGDEYDVRRVPTDRVTTTATLVKNGRWYLMEEHPNRNRGPVVFEPEATGVSSILGGDLTNLPVAPLAGGDRQGRLYGYLNDWTGPTLKVDGEYLPTRAFKIERQ